MAPCPCGSNNSYSKCCGLLHRDTTAYKQATAEQVVRARYSAFAQKQPEFLILTTHPLNKDFNTDLKKWKESIRMNMYDNFELSKCIIVEEIYLDHDNEENKNDNKTEKNNESKAINDNSINSNQQAQVKFVAQLILKQSGEVTAFMETALMERAQTHGGWLYLNGTIDAVPLEIALTNKMNLTEHAHNISNN